MLDKLSDLLLISYSQPIADRSTSCVLRMLLQSPFNFVYLFYNYIILIIVLLCSFFVLCVLFFSDLEGRFITADIKT